MSPTRARWDPNLHPRGPLGRFIDTSGAVPSRRADSPTYARTDYLSGSVWSGTPLQNLPDEYRMEAETYQTASDINGVLRRNTSGVWAMNDRQRDRAHVMDAVVEANQLTEDTRVYRGVRSGRTGESPLAGAQPGDQVRDAGFSSTSLDFGVATEFGDDVMEIDLPAGTHVAPLSTLNPTEFGKQLELVVGRGAVFEIDSIEQTDAPGFWGSGNVRIIRSRLVGYLED